MSLVCTVLLVLLGVMEVRDFLKERLTTDMLVDISHDDDRLTINLDIVFPRMPCEVLTLDVQDVMQMQINDIRGEVDMRRLSSDGQVIGSTSMIDYMKPTNREFIDHLQGQIEAQQGCQIYGHFNINRAPGLFRISTHARDELTLSMILEKGYSFDFSYVINHLSFGKDIDIRLIKKQFGE